MATQLQQWLVDSKLTEPQDLYDWLIASIPPSGTARTFEWLWANRPEKIIPKKSSTELVVVDEFYNNDTVCISGYGDLSRVDGVTVTPCEGYQEHITNLKQSVEDVTGIISPLVSIISDYAMEIPMFYVYANKQLIRDGDVCPLNVSLTSFTLKLDTYFYDWLSIDMYRTFVTPELMTILRHSAIVMGSFAFAEGFCAARDKFPARVQFKKPPCVNPPYNYRVAIQ